MPYWSSSRVGVQPTPKPKQAKRSERFGRQKGITMEDLKKQTALRLAQEQNRQSQKGVQSPGFSGGARSGGSNGRTTDAAQPRAVQPQQPRPPAPAVAAAPPPPPPPPPPAARDYTDPYAQRQHDARVDMGPYGFERSSSRGQQRTAPPPPVPSATLAPRVGGADFLVNSSSSHSTTSSYAETTSTAPASGKQKSKLPHGLTVQELKEMTKARLQAEAASKNQEIRRTRTPEPHSRPPASPVPPGFRPHSGSDWPQEHPPHQESWDNNSGLVGASRPPPPQSSETYPGQSSGFSGPQANQDSAFPRASSFPDAPEFDANRRRAVTMSPRFSYAVHEDREVLDAFSQPPRERAFSSDPPMFPRHEQQQQLGVASSASSAFASPSAVVGNRARASSATSLPPISNTADEFGLEAPPPEQPPSSLRFNPYFGAVREDVPVTPGLADVFRVSSFDKSPMLPTSNGHTISVDREFAQDMPQQQQSQDNRIRASTWSEPNSMFGSCGDISDDLASILKLSGAEDKNL